MILLELANALCFRLDDLLFPGWRDVEVRAPVFIVGAPRSGSTFLQRTLERDEGRFTTTRTWELLLAPSVVQRKVLGVVGAIDRALGRPGHRLLVALERRLFAPAAHRDGPVAPAGARIVRHDSASRQADDAGVPTRSSGSRLLHEGLGLPARSGTATDHGLEGRSVRGWT